MTALSLDEASQVFSHLPPFVRAGLAFAVVTHADGMRAFIVAACERWPDHFVQPDGTFASADGHGVDPATSGQRFQSAFEANRRLARAADAFLKSRHPTEDLEGLLVKAAYATNRMLEVGLVEAPPPPVVEVIAGPPPSLD